MLRFSRFCSVVGRSTSNILDQKGLSRKDKSTMMTPINMKQLFQGKYSLMNQESSLRVQFSIETQWIICMLQKTINFCHIFHCNMFSITRKKSQSKMAVPPYCGVFIHIVTDVNTNSITLSFKVGHADLRNSQTFFTFIFRSS